MEIDKEAVEAAENYCDRSSIPFCNPPECGSYGDYGDAFLAGVKWREETILNDPFSKFDHPCKNTCSGWRQGYERGHQRFLNDSDSKWKVKFEESEKEIAKLKAALEEIRQYKWTTSNKREKTTAEQFCEICMIADEALSKK